MRGLTDADATALKEKNVKIYHGNLEPGMALYIPPAYLTGMAALSAEGPVQPAGLRTTFLPAACLAWQEQ
eukprot:6079528-Alexandrium_andersonii.AAC.1